MSAKLKINFEEQFQDCDFLKFHILLWKLKLLLLSESLNQQGVGLSDRGALRTNDIG